MQRLEPRVALPAAANSRFWLWIDGVGGFLVCSSAEVSIGRPDGSVDVPLLADISRRHAVLRREGEDYVIDPLRPVSIDGKSVAGPTPVRGGATIELAARVRLRLVRPHPLSTTARLEFVSRHSTEPASDAVILFGQSCLLGPAAHCHVRCATWNTEAMLYQKDLELRCRGAMPLEVDGQKCGNDATLTEHSRVVGPGFSFGLEPAKR